MAKVKWFLCIVPLVLGLIIGAGGVADVYGDEGQSQTGMGMAETGSGEVMEFSGMHGPIWRLAGDRPFLVGGYGDNFSYDGTRVVPLVGKAAASLDTNKNTGTAMFKVYGTINPEKNKTYTGEITFYFTPGDGGPAFQEGGVADFVYLHGDTGQDAPVMPRSRAFVASWGTADVYINGKLVYPGLMGHIMYTEGVRDHVSQEVYNGKGNRHYDPKKPGDGSVADPDARELHFVAHSMKSDKNNFPPNSVWLHLNFEGAAEAGGAGCSCGCGMNSCDCGGTGGCGHSKGSCGIAGCGCGCADGGDCGCAAAGKAPGKANCGVAGCGCGCADGGDCGCAAAGKAPGKANCGVAGCACGCADGGDCTCGPRAECSSGCDCGCADGGPCGCAGNAPGGPAEAPQGAPKFDM